MSDDSTEHEHAQPASEPSPLSPLPPSPIPPPPVEPVPPVQPVSPIAPPPPVEPPSYASPVEPPPSHDAPPPYDPTIPPPPAYGAPVEPPSYDAPPPYDPTIPPPPSYGAPPPVVPMAPPQSPADAARAAWEAQRAATQPTGFDSFGAPPLPPGQAPPSADPSGWGVPAYGGPAYGSPAASQTPSGPSDGRGLWIAAIVAVVLVVGLVIVVVSSSHDKAPPVATDTSHSPFTAPVNSTDSSVVPTGPLKTDKAVPAGFKTITADNVDAVSVPESWEAGTEGSSAIINMRILLQRVPPLADSLDYIETTPDIYGKLFGFRRGASQSLLIAAAEDPVDATPDPEALKSKLRSEYEGSGVTINALSAGKVRLNGHVAVRLHVVITDVSGGTSEVTQYQINTKAHLYTLLMLFEKPNEALATQIGSTFVVS